MNRFWPKITVIVVLVVVAAVAAYVFWPAKTKQTAESKSVKHLQKLDKPKLKVQADIAQTERQQTEREGIQYLDEKIAVKYPDNLQPGQQVTLPRNRPPWSKEQPTLAERRIRPQYPSGTESEKAGLT